MTDLFLIAHKVRGEAAFDVAVRMECPSCLGHGDKHRLAIDLSAIEISECHDCDGEGFWWIIPTSGHRAYPYWSTELLELGEDQSWPGEPAFQSVRSMISEHPMPESWPDHYPHAAEPSKPKINVAGLVPVAKPLRRF